MMPAMESRSPAYTNGHGNMPRRQDGNRYLSSSPSGNQYLPSDEPVFAFSAEPGMMNYNTMGALHSNEAAENSVFTPNTGSSYDSLHPDVINQTYAQPNQYLQHQMQHLSGNSASHSLSPSVNSLNEHVSPEGYISDSIYQDYSQYTTPSFGDSLLDNPLLENQLGSLLHISDTNEGSPYDGSYQGSTSMSLGVDANSMRGFSQAQMSQSSNARSDSHLLSPCLTSNSSPVIGDESANNLNVAAIRLTGNDFQPQSTPSPSISSGGARPNHRQQQHSPALTNSPGGAGGVTLANPQPRAPHLTSPIVRVENYSRGESPARSDISRTMSKRSHGSRRSGTHLSPYPVDDSSADEMEEEPPPVRSVSVTPERREDGSWLVDNSSGQAGLSPADREAMKDIHVPTIEEIAEQRIMAEKKAEVQEWLTKSEVGSEAGDVNVDVSAVRKKRTTNRRRAKSQNDANVRRTLGSTLGLGVQTIFDDSGIPGPGVYVDERSELDEDEEEDDYEEEDNEPESPPAQIDVAGVETEPSFFSPTLQKDVVPEAPVGTRPWNDVPFQPDASGDRYQPPTSNAAMMRFYQRAKDIESASLAATIGSRRVSESDLGSLYAAGGVSKLITTDLNQAKPKDKTRERRPSFLDNILPKRTVNNNVLKRKGSHPIPPPQAPDSAQIKAKDPQPLLEKPKRIGSWGRPKSPRLDTNVATNSRDIGPPGSGNLSATSGPWAHAKNAIRRSRSRSDLGKSPGLAELMTQHGGPPMLTLASPLADTEATKNSPLPSPGGDDDDNNMDDEGISEAVIMDLKVRSDPIIPTYEGFKTHARQLNPRLVDYMVERITQEQMRRYKRLLEFRVKHLNAVNSRKCASTSEFCVALGGDSKQLPPRAGNKDSDAPFIGFQITAPGASDDDGEAAPEGTVVSAQFPPGVPLPPVKRLPAEFECPLCFKVKKFYKPSDWTKHVHEDVQPFTCTFPNCGEPKSFKRKADWVRHENERHRQLENWTCTVADCNHTCYRKDNFVQHLVREHKIAEPRARTGRSGNSSARDTSAHPDNMGWSTGFSGASQNPKDPSDDVWALVEKCRRDTTKQPKDEPCRFCGNILNSWKKLTVHLAKHMEQISMPILPLVEQKQLHADTIISPVVEMPEHPRNQAATPSKSPSDNPSRYNPGSTMSSLGSGFDQATYSQYSSNVSQSGLTAPVMHSYPPPQFAYRSQQPSQNPSYNFAMDQTQSYAVRSYPGLLDTRQRSPQGNGVYSSNQTYQGNMQNSAGQYAPITPVSATYGQPQVFSSPVDTTPYSNDIPSAYFTAEPQSTSAAPQAGLNGSTPLGFDQSSGVPFTAAGYQQMPQYMQQQQQQQQQNYPYQG